jgi:uncharacterized protein
MPATGAIRAAHYPGRAPISAYGNGGFRFADMSHRGDLLCLPSGIYGWDAPQASALDEASLARVFAEADGIEILLLGTGPEIVPVPPALRVRLREVGIVPEPMSTGAAVRTFNVLLAEGRAVAAALIAVD